MKPEAGTAEDVSDQSKARSFGERRSTRILIIASVKSASTKILRKCMNLFLFLDKFIQFKDNGDMNKADLSVC